MTDRHGERWAKADIGDVADALDGASAEVEQEWTGNTLTLTMGSRGSWTENLPGPCSDTDIKEAAKRLAMRGWGCQKMTPEILGMMVANAVANAEEQK